MIKIETLSNENEELKTEKGTITVRGLINLALSNLELGNPTQETINKATNYLKEAVLQIKKEKEETKEESQEYKVWLFNALYDTNYVQDEYPNLNGEFYHKKTCKRKIKMEFR